MFQILLVGGAIVFAAYQSLLSNKSQKSEGGDPDKKTLTEVSFFSASQAQKALIVKKCMNHKRRRGRRMKDVVGFVNTNSQMASLREHGQIELVLESLVEERLLLKTINKSPRYIATRSGRQFVGSVAPCGE